MIRVQIGVDQVWVEGKIRTVNEAINDITIDKLGGVSSQDLEMQLQGYASANEMREVTESIQGIKSANYVSQGTLDIIKATLDNQLQGAQGAAEEALKKQLQAIEQIQNIATQGEEANNALQNLRQVVQSVQGVAQQAQETARNAAQGQIDGDTVRNEVQLQLQGLNIPTDDTIQGIVSTKVTESQTAIITEITKEDGTIMVTIKGKINDATQGVQGIAKTAQGIAENAQGLALRVQGMAEVTQGFANKIQGFVFNAQGVAWQAQGAAANAQGVATQAKESAQSALENAQGAINRANEAQGIAQNAHARALQGVTQEQVDTAIGDWARTADIATNASVQDQIRTKVGEASDSLVQEVGDMINDAMENTADHIDFDGLAIPVEQSEDSSNSSFNELVNKLQEKPVRKSDVLKKVLDEDAYYWYVMPIIDQRIYRDTVVEGVTVEYGWQKAVKERYWYHKGDSNIRDHYIYLFRSEINALEAKTGKSILDGLPQFLPLNGENRKLRDVKELPTNMCIIGSGQTTGGQRTVKPTASVMNPQNPLESFQVPITKGLTPKAGKTVPTNAITKTAGSGSLTGKTMRIDSSDLALPAARSGNTASKRILPTFNRSQWNTWISQHQPNEGTYPADFYYIGCYAECDDSSMYENWMYTTQEIASSIKAKETPSGNLPEYPNLDTYTMVRLSKDNEGKWYFTDNNENYIVDAKYRSYYYEYTSGNITKAFTKLGSKIKVDDEGKLQRRPFADVCRDIKVHMLPIYLLGSTGIAIDSDDVDADGKYNYVTIDSILTPASGTKPQQINKSNTNAISLGNASSAINHVCRDNVAMAETGLPCVYGCGYTWLPLDAKGNADDEGGLGVHCDYTQESMWIANGIYSHYNGLIPSGYNKMSLQSMATMYKYKIIEKFALGDWTVISNGSMNTWTPAINDYSSDEKASGGSAARGFLPIFVDDYSDDGLADLNEELYNINISGDLITYTLKDKYLVGNEVGGNGVTHSRYITDTLKFMTENGKVNTNNIFLLCVEDDGDEYIFDEYIWEKGKVLKLNEQKKLKYSEELRKVEYECEGIGLTGRVYNNTLISGDDDTERTSNIMDYICTEQQVQIGETANPNYNPGRVATASIKGTIFKDGEPVTGSLEHSSSQQIRGQRLEAFANTGAIDAMVFNAKCIALGMNIKNYPVLTKVDPTPDPDPSQEGDGTIYIVIDKDNGIASEYKHESSSYFYRTYNIQSSKWSSWDEITDEVYKASLGKAFRYDLLNNIYLLESGSGEGSLYHKRTIITDEKVTYKYDCGPFDEDFSRINWEASNEDEWTIALLKGRPCDDAGKEIEEGKGGGEVVDDGGDPDSTPTGEEGMKFTPVFNDDMINTLITVWNNYRVTGELNYFNNRKRFSPYLENCPTFTGNDIPTTAAQLKTSLNEVIFGEEYASKAWYYIDAIIYTVLDKYMEMSHQSLTGNKVNYVFTLFEKCFNKVYADTVAQVAQVISKNYIGIDNYNGFQEFERVYNAAIAPSGGNPTIPIYDYVMVPKVSQGASDKLKRYNKILSFLIMKNKVVDDDNVETYEWIYTCYRYMPASNTYINVGNRSFIGDTKPTKALLNGVSTDDITSGNSEEQTHRKLNLFKQDILSRIDFINDESELLKRMPRLKAIIEQCFVETNVTDDDGVSRKQYTLAGVPSMSGFNQLITRMNTVDSNMVNMATAVNNGNRVRVTGGVLSEDNEPIFASAQVNQAEPPTQTPAPTVNTETSTQPNITVPASNNNTRSYTSTKTDGVTTGLRRKRLL